MLSPNRTRGSVGLASLLLAGLLVGGVFVPAACLIAARNPEASSPFYSDMRIAGTTPGTPANGFVGRFADGTTAQIVQVSTRTPNGIRAWKPSGEPIAEARRRGVRHGGVHDRSILIRYRKRTAKPEGGLSSGPQTRGEPTLMEFGGGGDQAGPTAKVGESYSYIGVPKEDGDRASFTFDLSNEPWKTYRLPNRPQTFHKRLHPATPLGLKAGEDLRNVVVERKIATPVLRDARGMYAKDSAGKLRRGNVPSTALTFTPPTNGKATIALVKARLRSGGAIKPFWNENVRHGDEFALRYHFRQKPEAIASFVIRARGSRFVEFHDVRLKPNAP